MTHNPEGPRPLQPDQRRDLDIEIGHVLLDLADRLGLKDSRDNYRMAWPQLGEQLQVAIQDAVDKYDPMGVGIDDNDRMHPKRRAVLWGLAVGGYIAKSLISESQYQEYSASIEGALSLHTNLASQRSGLFDLGDFVERNASATVQRLRGFDDRLVAMQPDPSSKEQSIYESAVGYMSGPAMMLLVADFMHEHTPVDDDFAKYVNAAIRQLQATKILLPPPRHVLFPDENPEDSGH